MAQTTDEVVSKKPERWRVLETEEAPSLSTPSPLAAHLATCRFTGASWSTTRRYEFSASSCGRSRDKQKKDVKDLTCFHGGITRQKSSKLFRTTASLILGLRQLNLFGASVLQSLALDSPAWHPYTLTVTGGDMCVLSLFLAHLRIAQRMSEQSSAV